MRVKNPPPPQFFITHEYPALISLKRQETVEMEDDRRKQETRDLYRTKRQEKGDELKKERDETKKHKRQGTSENDKKIYCPVPSPLPSCKCPSVLIVSPLSLLHPSCPQPWFLLT
jgi:hypothetical protein